MIMVRDSPKASRGRPQTAARASFALVVAALAFYPPAAGQGLLAALEQASAGQNRPDSGPGSVTASSPTTPPATPPPPASSPALLVPETPAGESDEMQKELKRWRLSPAKAQRLGLPHLAGAWPPANQQKLARL